MTLSTTSDIILTRQRQNHLDTSTFRSSYTSCQSQRDQSAWIVLASHTPLENGLTYNSNLLHRVKLFTSKTFKKMLDKIFLTPNASIFTYNAVSMYTNISTGDCIERLTTFLLNPHTGTPYLHLSPQALVEAISIVMKNNRMRFGDLIAHQHKGVAMGMAPAPTISNIYVAIFKNEHLVNKWSTHLYFLGRFIDDGFGI